MCRRMLERKKTTHRSGIIQQEVLAADGAHQLLQLTLVLLGVVAAVQVEELPVAAGAGLHDEEAIGVDA